LSWRNISILDIGYIWQVGHDVRGRAFLLPPALPSEGGVDTVFVTASLHDAFDVRTCHAWRMAAGAW
jgi:hypothetical protein